MATSAVSASSNATNGINLQDFLKILATQLRYQDPLAPMSNQEFIAQMAQFTSLQQTQLLNSKIDSLLQIQAATQSVGLIGRTVEVQTMDNGRVVASVSALDFSSGAPLLTANTSGGEVLTGISLSQIALVR